MIEKYIEHVPAKDEECTRWKCDICGTDLGEQEDHDRATMEYKKGTVYPEGDCREGEVIDICANCMKTKVMPRVATTFKITPRDYSEYY